MPNIRQRPKIDEYDTFTYFVVHGAVSDTAETTEMHYLLYAHCLVTVHHGDCPALPTSTDEFEQRHNIWTMHSV